MNNEISANSLAIEGLPRSGKTTLINSLRDLTTEKNFSLLFFQEFSDTDLGLKITESVESNVYRRWPFSVQALLFLADKCWTSYYAKQEFVKSKKRIIFDRSIFSNVSFQLALDKKTPATFSEIIDYIELNKTITSYEIIIPDMLIFLDIPPSLCYSRGLPKDFFSLEELTIIRKNYLTLINNFQFYIIDGTKPNKIILEEVLEILKDLKWI